MSTKAVMMRTTSFEFDVGSFRATLG